MTTKPRRRKGKIPLGPNMMAFTSPEDLMKNLPKMMSNISRMTAGGGSAPTDSPTFKMSMKEYEDIGIKVGDKVTIEIKKSENSGIYDITNLKIVAQSANTKVFTLSVNVSIDLIIRSSLAVHEEPSITPFVVYSVFLLSLRA